MFAGAGSLVRALGDPIPVHACRAWLLSVAFLCAKSTLAFPKLSSRYAITHIFLLSDHKWTHQFYPAP